MKKNLLKLFIFFIMYVAFPSICFAITLSGDILQKNESIPYLKVDDKFLFENIGLTRYVNLLNSNKPGFKVVGSFKNYYGNNIDALVTVYLYDKNKNEIANFSEEYTIPSGTKLYRYDFTYYQEADSKLIVSNIEYYKIEMEVLTDLGVSNKNNNNSYYFENYNLRINVNENNVYNVTEKYEVNFKNGIVPIIKDVNIRHKYTRDDGTKVNKRAIISNIVVNDTYFLSTVEAKRRLKIGIEDRKDKENNLKNVNVTFDYNVGKDVLDNADEFVYYLTNFNSKINNMTFEITMPREFDSSTIGVYDENGILFERVNIETEGRVIKGNFKSVVQPNNKYYIKVLLPDNYFKNTSSNVSVLSVMSFILPILFIIISVVIWFKLNKKQAVKKIIHLYYDENINSLEMGYLYNGKIKDNDISTLIFYLANKGYINIVSFKDDYKIVKNKKYDGKNKLEKIFLTILFKEKDELNREELMKIIPMTKELLKEEIKNKYREQPVIVRPIFNYKLIFWLMVLFIFILITLNTLVEYQTNMILINLIVSGIGYIVLLRFITERRSVIEKIIVSLISLLLIIMPIVLGSYKAFVLDKSYIFIYVVGVISMTIIALISNSMSNRTMYGRRVYSELISYKEKLLNSSVEKVKFIGEEYIYKILPFAFVLGISDKWMDKFENEKCNKPEWFISDKFTINNFYELLKDVYSDSFMALKNSIYTMKKRKNDKE